MHASRLALVLVTTWSLVLAVPSDGAACCAAPQPEGPRLVTPSGATVAPGGAIVMYLSRDAVQQRIALVRDGTSTELVPARRELAPHVFALDVPSDTPPGLHDVRVTPTDAQRARGRAAYETGTLTIGGAISAAPLPAPRGHLRLGSSRGRWGPSRSVAFVFDGAPPAGAGIVFSWTDASGPHGNASWISPATQPAMVAEGHCGITPFGTSVPVVGTDVRIAYVDLAGRLGPWASFRVE